MLAAGMFILGFFCGLAIIIAIFVILTYFKASLQFRIKTLERKISAVGPQPKGAILFPDDDATLARKEYIAKNKAIGRDVPISELQ